MQKERILAALRKAVPGQADYGEINEIRIEHYNNEVIKRLVDVILEQDYNRFVQSLADNVQLGLKEW